MLSGVRAAGPALLSGWDSGSTGSRVSGLVNGELKMGDGRRLRRMVVHLLNFPHFIGSWIKVGTGSGIAGRAMLTAGGWTLTIDESKETGRPRRRLEIARGVRDHTRGLVGAQ